LSVLISFFTFEFVVWLNLLCGCEFVVWLNLLCGCLWHHAPLCCVVVYGITLLYIVAVWLSMASRSSTLCGCLWHHAPLHCGWLSMASRSSTLWLVVYGITLLYIEFAVWLSMASRSSTLWLSMASRSSTLCGCLWHHAPLHCVVVYGITLLYIVAERCSHFFELWFSAIPHITKV
jgi:hypothetical protein